MDSGHNTNPLPPLRGNKKKGHRAGRIVLLVFIFAAGLIAGNYLSREGLLQTVGLGKKSETAQQSMGPGTRASGPADKGTRDNRKILYWVDPMNPSHKSDKPGKAPDGMDLVPVYAEPARPESAMPAGTVRITPRMQQLIGVKYGEVTEGPVAKTILTVGQVVTDETKVARIQTRIEGWIDKVYADFTGKLVQKSQPLISIYSPELVSTQQELLIAKQAREHLAGSEFLGVSANALSLYNATRQRLRLWNISDQQIREIEQRGVPTTSLTLYSPFAGFVLSRNAFPGQRISPDTELYSIADLSTVWLLTDIYEYELPMVQLGQTASLRLPYFPGETFQGKVSYIYPTLDNVSRTLKVRFDLANPHFKLKPDMYANVELHIDLGRHMSVPEDAVLFSGTEEIVFVARGDGYFEPRKVQVGAKADGRYIILGGLQTGERIVTSGNYLIDSESNLKSALSGMQGMPGMSPGGPGSGAPPAGRPAPPPAPSRIPPGEQRKPAPGNMPSMPGMDHGGRGGATP